MYQQCVKLERTLASQSESGKSTNKQTLSPLFIGTMVLYLMETEAGGKADLLSTSGQRLMESNPAQSM